MPESVMVRFKFRQCQVLSAWLEWFALVCCPQANHLRGQWAGQQCCKKGKMRREYAKHSCKEKLAIAKRAAEHGVAKTIWQFKDKESKEGSVRDWKKAYLKELRSKVISSIPGKEVTVRSLPGKQKGTPPLLGVKLDRYLQEIMRNRGTPVGTSIIQGVARRILLKNSKSMVEDFGGSIRLNREWARSVLRRMRFTKQK